MLLFFDFQVSPFSHPRHDTDDQADKTDEPGTENVAYDFTVRGLLHG